MARKATSQDVADLAGVSRTAVSLVLNGRAEGIVAPHKQALIIEAARSLRYRPDTVALSLRTRRTMMLALVADLADPQVNAIVAGAVAAADYHGYVIMVLDAGGPDPFETSDNRRVDGVIMVGPTDAAPDRPVVVIDTAASPGRPSFVPDLSGGARVGLEHLLDLGHRQIGVVGDERTRIGQSWRHGIDEALQAASVEAAWSGADDSIAGGRVATGELLTRHPGVTAVACLSDRMAVGAYLAAAERKRGVPDGLSVLGFDEDSSLATGLAPPLSTIRLPRRELGERATDEIIRALALGGSVPVGTITLSAHLVVRGSTAPV